ncbi:hypothetical protein FZC33_24350 [Labrys sp. KNU-23]|uniref:DUF6958 family protein n=1 Tax=Labrys sp. KNU-23 TaxID=2789216 RepID=UPI0011EE6466|nr:hypothetical protein [Labrys sp. KNU-23]QEN89246.1 hypothetical protein FZC33_24350 [Labrys sp. KNU-23]
MTDAGRIELLNVNHPGKARPVDAAMYGAMKAAMLAFLPDGKPGLTVAQLQAGVPALLPQDLYPGGAKAGWWVKAVQLDLEARGIIRREKVSPLRLYRA